jgi:hypothetical protein
MKICFFRSSSFNTHTWCEHKYFLEYNLGIRFPGNAKADLGTTFHKIMEILGKIKKAKQNKEKYIEDEILGRYKVAKNVRVDLITDQVFNHYQKLFHYHGFNHLDLKHIRQWVKSISEFREGIYNPLNQEIFQTEQHFEFPIEQEWAKFEYVENDEKIRGYLGLKGTIDLITKHDKETLHIIDYKTGRRLDWATGQEKTYEKLMTDPQLLMYHYAVSYLYPEYENVMVTIYYLKDGGPFTLCFSPEHLYQTEQMLKKKFDKIKSTQIPRLSKSWKCTKMCPFSKASFPNPLIEFRGGQFTAIGQPMSMCQQAEYMIKQKGIDWVEENYKQKDHKLDFYKAPGAT